MIVVRSVALACLALGLLLSAPALAQSAGALKVTVEGLRSDDGKVRVAVYAGKEGFPSDITKALRTTTVVPSERRAVAIFEDLPLGTYAVAVLHDENGNGKADTNFLGIPKEGIGASRDAPASFGPPKFRDAVFPLDKPRLAIKIKIRYL